MSLCVKSVSNLHIIPKRNGIDIYKSAKFQEFPMICAKFSFSMTFPGLNFIFSFPMVFHDFPWSWEPCFTLMWMLALFWQDVITSYTRQLLTDAVELLTKEWGTSALPVPDDMLAPNMRSVRLPDIPAMPLKARHGTLTVRRTDPGNHETFPRCWFNVGPPSTTSGQHWTNIGWTSRVCWDDLASAHIMFYPSKYDSSRFNIYIYLSNKKLWKRKYIKK